MAAIAACSRPTPPAAAPAPAHPPPLDYAAPPELTSAAHAAHGMVILSGTGRPAVAIRFASPDGSAIAAAATGAGGWTLSAPVGAAPRIYSLSESFDGRLLRARGYVAVLPAPAAPAVLLRPGTAAEPLPGVRPRLRLSAVDFDRGGAGVVAGLARPGEAVKVELDGAEAGEARANGQGVFTAPLTRILSPGAHKLTAVTVQGRAEAGFDAAPAGAIARPPFTATRAGASWRVDWMTPGGGVQTTILFDPAEARS